MRKTTGQSMRLIHRYLGFFLAGIMAMYALSGIVLVFRKTDFLKQEVQEIKLIDANLNTESLAKQLNIKDIEITKVDGAITYFPQGEYNANTGEATLVKKELPFVLNKMTSLHKATTNSPVYWLNIFFGLSLLFFVVSSFWMFLPHTSVFKKGVYFSIAGIILTIILLFI